MSTPVAVGRAMRFFEVVGKLKNLKRTGWVNHGIPLPESVADHMYRMTMISFLATDAAINKDRLMKMCLVHDLAEAVVGDITPVQGVSKAEKRLLEERALRGIVADLEHADIGEEILHLWLEFEECSSNEAKFANQLDKLEMIIQANEYEKMHKEQSLDSFFSSTADFFTHPEIKAWADAVREERSKRRAEGV